MPRHILTTALFATSLALAAPILAAPKAAASAPTKTHTESKPNGSLKFAERIRAADLIGLWGSAVQTNKGSLLNITQMNADGTGMDLMVFTLNKPESSLKISQTFTWQFNEKTQIFTLRATDFIIAEDNSPYKQDKTQIGKTRTAKVRVLLVDGKPDMLEFTDQTSGEKVSYFNQYSVKRREALK